MNRLESFATLLDIVPPFEGVVPAGYTVDFLGTLTNVNFRERVPHDPGSDKPRHVTTRAP